MVVLGGGDWRELSKNVVGISEKCLLFPKVWSRDRRLASPRQLFGFSFIGDTRLYKDMIAGPGKFHRLPLTLLTNCVHSARFSMERHQVDDPQHRLLGHSHQVPFAAFLPPTWMPANEHNSE